MADRAAEEDELHAKILDEMFRLDPTLPWPRVEEIPLKKVWEEDW
jgi:hypothetical protein